MILISVHFPHNSATSRIAWLMRPPVTPQCMLSWLLERAEEGSAPPQIAQRWSEGNEDGDGGILSFHHWSWVGEGISHDWGYSSLPPLGFCFFVFLFFLSRRTEDDDKFVWGCLFCFKFLSILKIRIFFLKSNWILPLPRPEASLNKYRN